jgi:hypothetical protein
MSGSANPDFFRVSTLKKSWVYTRTKKNKGDKTEKKSRFAEPDFFSRVFNRP